MTAEVDEQRNIRCLADAETATSLDENMNNEEYAKGTGVRKKDEDNAVAKQSRKLLQKYWYHQDYHEALRSLLWEPYDCRTNNNNGENDDEPTEEWCLLNGNVSDRKMSCSDVSTVSSSSSEESAGFTDKRISWPMVRPSTRASKTGRPLSQQLGLDLSSGACDPDGEQMDGMVSDLDGCGEDVYGTRSCQQGALPQSYVWQPWQCQRRRAQGGTYDHSVEMVNTVPGILEPPDASDSTRLVDLPSLPESRPSTSNNVSVVNCYRAVPVAVVTSVPTIKCLNTQENVSNVNVVQTYVRPMRNPPSLPGTSKVHPKARPSSVMVPKPESHSRDPALSNHSRSVSNPVLGFQPRLTPSNFGSQQNLPNRLETHFGDGLAHSQTILTKRAAPPPPTEVNVIHSNPPPPLPEPPKPRTFTSTEAQTDDIGVPLSVPLRNITNREQRRRERRERRQQRRLHQSAIEGWQTNLEGLTGEVRGLPDILHSHLPPPYIPGTSMPPPLPNVHAPPPLPMLPPALPHLVDPALGSPPHPPVVGFPFPFSGSSRRSRLSPRNSGYADEEETPKACCGMVVTQAVSIRWFIIMIAFVGFCCVTVGTVLGAMKASGREHLTVSLLMIGVGIVLVTVSVVAWRLTSQDAPSCRSMLGFGSGEDSATEPNRRFVPRMPPSYGRPHHPYAAMMYPDFQYRPPPPSYQASMQEYRLRLLLLERPGVPPTANAQGVASPPPVYRSHAGSTLGLRAPTICRSVPQSEYSHPPSYRSRTSSTRPSVHPGGGSIVHSRDPSLISQVSDGNGTVQHAVVNVISVLGNTVELHQTEDLQLDSLKLCVDGEVPIPPLRMLLSSKSRQQTTTQAGNKSDNVNLVTIVTVSDSSTPPQARENSSTMDNNVLAHL